MSRGKEWNREGRGVVLFDMGDFLLLFMIRLHLINLVLLLRLDVGRVITGIVYQLLLVCQVHDVRAHRVHKILRVGGDNQDMIVR